MQNKLSFLTFMIFLLLIGCAAESSNSPQETAPEQEAEISKNDPCGYISLDKFAEIFGLDASQLSTRSEEFAGTSTCTFITSEIAADPGDDPEDVAVIAVRYNEDGKFGFGTALQSQLARGTYKVPAGPDKDKEVPLRKIEQLGDDAAGHAAAHYATIIFQDDNKIRISVTIYRKIPDNFIFNGLELTDEEALEKLEVMAKSLDY